MTLEGDTFLRCGSTDLGLGFDGIIMSGHVNIAYQNKK